MSQFQLPQSRFQLPQPHASSPPLRLDRLSEKYSWARGTARGTEASRERYQTDLRQAFSEIDGLLAGFTYLDKMDPSQQVADSSFPSPLAMDEPLAATEPEPILGTDQYPMDITDIDLSEGEDHGTVPPCSASSSDAHRQPMAAQWDAIRDLRKETEFHHQRFQRMELLSNDPILAQLREAYKDSKSVRITGILIFKDVLDGFKPTKLKDIFAFASLSYAVSKLLFKSRRIDEMEIFAGIKAWRDSISDTGEREAFNKLARHLWPEAKNHLHFIPIPQRTPRSDTLWPWQPSSYQSMASDPMNRPGDIFPGPPLSHGGPVKNDMLDPTWALEVLHDINHISFEFADHVVDLTALTKDAWDLSKFRDFNPAASHHQPSSHGIPAVFAGQEGESQPCHRDWHLPQTEYPDLLRENGQGKAEQMPTQIDAETIQLRDTFVFVVVVAFIIEIKDLLHILRGNGLVSKSEKLYKAQIAEQKRFYKSAKEDFFEPRASSRPMPYRTYTALLSVAKLFTQEAYLKSISEVKHYLMTVAVVRKIPT